jgi:mannonate dehydratase
MKMTFRWYGESDPIPLAYIAQIPTMEGIVSAVYDVPPGKYGASDSIQKIKTEAKKHALTFEVVESVPVHEDIKLGKKTRANISSLQGEHPQAGSSRSQGHLLQLHACF